MQEETQTPFHWERHPKAEQFLREQLNEACTQHSLIAEMQEDLLKHTSTDLLCWVDHIAMPSFEHTDREIVKLGFSACETTPAYRVYVHTGAQLPHIVVYSGIKKRVVALKVESISDWLGVRGWTRSIEGDPLSGYRRCFVEEQNDTCLYVTERRATWTMEPTVVDDPYYKKALRAQELWRGRPRELADEEQMMQETLKIAREMVDLVGTDLSACFAMEHERWYWMRRNQAGRLQKERQDVYGMGWANHDHHTFRSSRRHFKGLVQLFQILGFHCRERFYAGAEAGWGAQVMENTTARLVLFLDVDLSPDEVAGDFSAVQLPERQELGTIGLWCGLHGDSLFQAGMHHLEAEFLFQELRDDLEHLGVGMMAPFSNFDYLKQAFTEGERWSVQPSRVQKLIDAGYVTEKEAQCFLMEGAIGSHLENLQRTEGFKGFNQKNVSYIIKKTDPRTAKLN